MARVLMASKARWSNSCPSTKVELPGNTFPRSSQFRLDWHNERTERKGQGRKGALNRSHSDPIK